MIYSYTFDFSPENESENEQTLQQLRDEVLGGRGSIERVERLFNITFAAGIENGKAVYLTNEVLGGRGEDCNNDDLATKFDGLVCLTVPPFDHETGKPFKRNKLTFVVKAVEIENHFERLTSSINSKRRNTVEM